MIVVIDNFDSFTYNIVEYYRSVDDDLRVFRNNEIGIKDIEALQPKLIVLSPGPKDPNSAGITMEVIEHFAGKIPIFGVCLGCQSIAQVFGAKIIRAEHMYHGKTSSIVHEGKGVLQGVSSPMKQMRYHSLIVDESTLPPELEVTARSEAGEIMALRHKEFGIEGVQFHPESVASNQGDIIMSNALKLQAKCAANEDTQSKTPAPNSPVPNTPVSHAEAPDSAKREARHQYIIEKLLNKENLTKKEAFELMMDFSDNQVSPERMALILTALRMKGESPEEIAGIAEAGRSRAIHLHTDSQEFLVDIVGTGGDARNTFNISTASGIVAAAAGARVAKHGNRAVSSKSGSADVLEALGMRIDVSPQEMQKKLQSAGMCFMFAPLYHPSMKYVAPVRRAMKVRTVFNILGPLINPAKVPNIVLGVFSRQLMESMADVLELMGIHRAMIIHSDKGMDEISIDDTTHIIEIYKNADDTYKRNEYDIQAIDLLDRAMKVSNIEGVNIDLFKNIDEKMLLEHIAGGSSEENAALIQAVFDGRLEMGLKRSCIEAILALNAGACLYVSGVTASHEEGIRLAYQSIRNGAALRVLDSLRS